MGLKNKHKVLTGNVEYNNIYLEKTQGPSPQKAKILKELNKNKSLIK